MSRILLTGTGGQVGFELLRSLSSLGEVVAADRSRCDLADPEAIVRLVREVQPDIIVNPAAYTAVDKAESEPALAEAINAIAPGVLAREARSRGAFLVHYSTDYVFDGLKPEAYREEDDPNPKSVYGQTKLAGEEAIRDSACSHFIFRTSWVFGAHGANFAKTMLRLGAEREVLKVVADQFGAPTSAALIADLTALALYRRMQAAAPSLDGTYHLVASGVTSWHAYASYVLAQARARGWSLAVKEICPIPTADYPLPAPRPASSRLDTSRFQNAFGLQIPDWRVHVSRLLEELKP